MRGIGYDSMGAMVEYDLTPKEEYLVVFDRGGDVIVRKMLLTMSEAQMIDNRWDIYAMLRMDRLGMISTISVEDLGEEEGV